MGQQAASCWLLKTHSGSAVLDGSVDRIRSRTLMFGKNCDGHALSALTAVVHCAFSLVFIHFCDHNLDSPSTTAGMSKNAAYLLTATLIWVHCPSWAGIRPARANVWRWWGPKRWLMFIPAVVCRHVVQPSQSQSFKDTVHALCYCTTSDSAE